MPVQQPLQVGELGHALRQVVERAVGGVAAIGVVAAPGAAGPVILGQAAAGLGQFGVEGLEPRLGREAGFIDLGDEEGAQGHGGCLAGLVVVEKVVVGRAILVARGLQGHGLSQQQGGGQDVRLGIGLVPGPEGGDEQGFARTDRLGLATAEHVEPDPLQGVGEQPFAATGADGTRAYGGLLILSRANATCGARRRRGGEGAGLPGLARSYG